MTNHLDELIARIADPWLRADLGKEAARLRDTKDFGLVYERHLPETSRLPNHPVRRGRVVCQPRHRTRDGGHQVRGAPCACSARGMGGAADRLVHQRRCPWAVPRAPRRSQIVRLSCPVCHPPFRWKPRWMMSSGSRLSATRVVSTSSRRTQGNVSGPQSGRRSKTTFLGCLLFGLASP